jgi:hypothetical protein
MNGVSCRIPGVRQKNATWKSGSPIRLSKFFILSISKMPLILNG